MTNRRALTLLFAANTVSGLAQGLSMLAIPWYFADALGKPQWFAAGFAATMALSIPWSLYAGTIVDRYSRKNLFLCLQAAGTCMLLGTALMGWAQGHVPALAALAVFTFTVLNFNVHYPAMYGFVQEITPPERYGKTISAIEIQGQSTSIVSGGLAAMLLQGYALPLPKGHTFAFPKWSLQDVFALDGATYVLGFCLVALIRYVPMVEREIKKGNALQYLKVGMRYLRDHPDLAWFGAFSYVLFAVLLVEVNTLLPPYVHNWLHGGALVFALAEVAYAAGAVGAGLFIRKIFKGVPIVRAIVVLYLGTAAMFVFATFLQSTLYLYAFSALLGLANGGTRVLRVERLFKEVGNEVIGRTNAAFTVANIIARVLFVGLLSLPFFFVEGNIRFGYLAMAGVLCLAAMGLVRFGNKAGKAT